MRRQVLLCGLVVLGLSGCASISSSNLNPLNWFGKSEAVTATTADGQTAVVLKSLAPRKGYPAFVDTRPLVPSVADITIARSTSGAIVTATGVVPTLGYYDAQLVPVANEAQGTLTYDFRISAPETAPALGTAQQRRITVAYSLTFPQLEGVTRIVVRGADGSRQTRR
ncbi:hypothetical protein [Celeribacter marinus]|uniref:hypothetical protein n=1 Tax=Celeribacter marinus TaxID=1397108 RepID=UPI0031793E06